MIDTSTVSGRVQWAMMPNRVKFGVRQCSVGSVAYSHKRFNVIEIDGCLYDSDTGYKMRPDSTIRFKPFITRGPSLAFRDVEILSGETVDYVEEPCS